MLKLYVSHLPHDRLSQEVAAIADILAGSGARSALVTVAFGLDPEHPLFGVPVPVATDLLPRYIRRLEDDGLCRLGNANITVTIVPGDGAAAGVEVFFANDGDIYLSGEEGPLLADVRDHWARFPNNSNGRDEGPLSVTGVL